MRATIRALPRNLHVATLQMTVPMCAVLCDVYAGRDVASEQFSENTTVLSYLKNRLVALNRAELESLQAAITARVSQLLLFTLYVECDGCADVDGLSPMPVRSNTHVFTSLAASWEIMSRAAFVPRLNQTVVSMRQVRAHEGDNVEDLTNEAALLAVRSPLNRSVFRQVALLFVVHAVKCSTLGLGCRVVRMTSCGFRACAAQLSSPFTTINSCGKRWLQRKVENRPPPTHSHSGVFSIWPTIVLR